MLGNLELLYLFISCLVMVVDVVAAIHCYAEKKKSAYVLGFAILSAGLVQLTYLGSLYTDNYFLRSIISSGYYIAIIFSLVVLLTFIRSYVLDTYDDAKERKRNKLIKGSGTVLFLVDCALFIINPFKEIVVHYAPLAGKLVHFTYEHKPLFWVHLLICYAFVAMIYVYLLKKVLSIPGEYRKQYMVAVYALVGVVILNALNIFIPTLFGSEVLDYSVWGYSFLGLTLYVNFFRYPVTGMKAYYHSWIVENVNQGMALINHDNRLIIHNNKLHLMFSGREIKESMTSEEFIECLGIEINMERRNDNYSFQHFIKSGDNEYPIRVDHRCPRNKKGESLGELFIFTDEQSDVDLTSSFYSWESFKQFIKDEPEFFLPPLTVTVCDINGLGDINRTLGHNVGDRCIAILAKVIRKHFTGESYFVRGQEASLVILSYDITEEEAKERIEAVRKELINQTEVDRVLDIQSAIEVVTSYHPDVLNAVERAFKGMKTKKLLDVNSSKSELVTSLVKTLAECDGDTEAHVKRTQALGAELGKRLNLSDGQLGDLALLCILHDIGKISIPLEILNKPGKLSDDEWRMMKTHTSKGYQIALSSRELEHIADMILHHHESWNGKGYPDGLSKESIPLLSRIISVVDAYDAMVNDRIYRPAMSIDAALAELKRCAGTQFDPSVVNEFVRMIPEIHEVGSNEKFDLINGVNDDGRASDVSTYSPTASSGLNKNVHVVPYCRYVLDDKMRIVDANDMFESLTGYTKEDFKNSVITQTDLLPEEDRTEYMTLVAEQISKNGLAYFEHRLKRKDGSIAYVFCYGKVYYDSAVKSERSEIIVFDSSSTHAMKIMFSEEQSKAELRLAKWEDKYRCDSLTGLLNHEAFKNDVETKLLEPNTRVMLLMMDADKFKNFNDTYGHKEGDEYLIDLANSLSSTLRKDDLACRMGGDEFAAALFYNNKVDDSTMLERAHQICDKLNYILSSKKGGTSMSMGAVTSDDQINTFNLLYEAADKALYEAKAGGRARIEVYDKK